MSSGKTDSHVGGFYMAWQTQWHWANQMNRIYGVLAHMLLLKSGPLYEVFETKRSSNEMTRKSVLENAH